MVFERHLAMVWREMGVVRRLRRAGGRSAAAREREDGERRLAGRGPRAMVEDRM